MLLRPYLMLTYTWEMQRQWWILNKKQDSADSLVEVVETPSIASSNTPISTPVQAHEVAVGLGFDHAEVQINLKSVSLHIESKCEPL